jgi:hypothetical protein
MVSMTSEISEIGIGRKNKQGYVSRKEVGCACNACEA